WLLEEKVADRALLFHCTVAPDTKFCPLIVKVKADSPALAELGFKEVMLGTGLDTVGKGELPDPLLLPPHEREKDKTTNDKNRPRLESNDPARPVSNDMILGIVSQLPVALENNSRSKS